ncbi:serine/threonine protein kinase [Leptolyngbya sp. FACHB-321]|uniref:serine/threonine-protein kinase n=1 Tax=Leptolyngbya sp. FACHB-321 TaxID=2692807 RepID=UPI0016891A0E|nr:serine/threonine-protein kinase [Leptolyngbya sp. FACHB-321]MBD2035020.1 serine/threonine protein kinase [Leptolyngbya sp. FACHB-321]
MDLYCTRPGCPRPVNAFADLDHQVTLKAVPQKYCTTCGMELILIGRYLPLRLLGQGGFGAAFLARDRYTPAMRQCVVKQFLPSGQLSPAQLVVAQQLFEREAEVLEQLGNTHPLIPDLFAFFELTASSPQAGKQDKFFYLVQEYIDGETMEEELVQKGTLSTDDVVAMLKEMLDVLTFVHENGSIHRDIKPSNIMRHRNGRFYLLDFGAVKQAAKGAATAKSTGIYSLGFAPPEQMSGGEVYPSSDLYALAITCLMLLTGKQPNDLFDSYSNTWKWRNDAPNVPTSLADVFDRMLLQTPSQRFQSAADVLVALKAASGTVRSQPSKRTPSPTPQPTPIPATTLPQPVSPPQAPQPTPGQTAPPVAVQSAKPVHQRAAIAPFSTVELLGAAAFTGFEGGLLAIALLSLSGTVLIGAGFWVVLLAGLVFLQSRRIIERLDLLIVVGLTLPIVLFLPPLHRVVVLLGGSVLTTVIAIAVVAGLSAIAVTAFFRIIFNLLSNWL